jgi:hypothetical protein
VPLIGDKDLEFDYLPFFGFHIPRGRPIDTPIRLCGLKIEPNLNGSLVLVEGIDKASGRIKVRIDMTNRVVRVKRENLHVSPVE